MSKPTIRIYITRTKFGARMMLVDLSYWYRLLDNSVVGGHFPRPLRMNAAELVEGVLRGQIPKPRFIHLSLKYNKSNYFK